MKQTRNSSGFGSWTDGTTTETRCLDGHTRCGKKVAVTGIVIHKVENGRFAKSWNEADLLGLKIQLE